MAAAALTPPSGQHLHQCLHVQPIENSDVIAPHKLQQRTTPVVAMDETIPITRLEPQVPEGAVTPEESTVEVKLAETIPAEEKQEASNQLAWDRAMSKEMGVPDGYENVAVLMLKWQDRIDQLKTSEEVNQLRALFQDRFNYKTKVVELGVHMNAQVQLDNAITNFILEHDGPSNLLIVYYSGHGSYDNNVGRLQLHASDVQDDFDTEHRARCVWEDAEKYFLRYVRADVLAIMDTCYAACVHKSSREEDTRAYELFTAAGLDRATTGPGPNSFTFALIESLKELLEEEKGKPFTTYQLRERIAFQEKRRRTPPEIWMRLRHYDRRIYLAPVKQVIERQEAAAFQPPQSYLTLRFGLRQEHLSREQLEKLAHTLSKAVKHKKASVDVQRIDYIRHRKRATNVRLRSLAHAVRAPGIMRALRKSSSSELLALPSPDGGRGVKRKRVQDDSSDDARGRDILTPTSSLGLEDGAT